MANLPLSVRSAGRYRLAQGWTEKAVRKWFVQIYWIVEGRGSFVLGERDEPVRAGQIFIHRPGDIHQVKVATPYWEYCWFTLDHPDACKWLEGFCLEKRVYTPGPCPVRLFSKMIRGLDDCTQLGERKNAHLAHELLLAASSQAERAETSLGVMARKLIDLHYQEPHWGISNVLDQLNVHRTTLLRNFTKDYGMPPSDYLQNRRIQKALGLLRSSSLRIQEVAWEAGFSDANYFARSIRRATGVTPGQFRLHT